jgi:hypothetical protein
MCIEVHCIIKRFRSPNGAGRLRDSEAQSTDEIKPNDFSLPTNKQEWDGLVEKLVALGLKNKDASANIEKRKRLLNAALRDFNKD